MLDRNRERAHANLKTKFEERKKENPFIHWKCFRTYYSITFISFERGKEQEKPIERVNVMGKLKGFEELIGFDGGRNRRVGVGEESFKTNH